MIRSRTSPLAMRLLFVALVLLVASFGSACSSTVVQTGADRQTAAVDVDQAPVGAVDTVTAAGQQQDLEADAVAEPAAPALGVECADLGDTSTSVILTGLVDELDGVAAHELADQAEDLASRLQGSDQTAQALVETMQLLTAAEEVLGSTVAGPCPSLLTAATGRLNTTNSALAEAAGRSQAGDSLTAQLARGFGLSAEDATCVSGHIGTNGDATDTAAVLFAIAACSEGANQSS